MEPRSGTTATLNQVRSSGSDEPEPQSKYQQMSEMSHCNPSETSAKGMVLRDEEVINKRKVLEDTQRSSSLETSQDLT